MIRQLFIFWTSISILVGRILFIALSRNFFLSFSNETTLRYTRVKYIKCTCAHHHMRSRIIFMTIYEGINSQFSRSISESIVKDQFVDLYNLHSLFSRISFRNTYHKKYYSMYLFYGSSQLCTEDFSYISCSNSH